ncbi:hypothetical protein KFK09_002860 [Dendrobium nobile]|uniref:Uncharacterized protein n=1 Tax=Dendrobium nobile TaxID=94219 RepID=A0A8T3C2J3_DENNO|nr:hypothetical protein KFK09_002860 [Dendrobium nobile]
MTTSKYMDVPTILFYHLLPDTNFLPNPHYVSSLAMPNPKKAISTSTPDTGKLYISRHVTFDDSTFPYSNNHSNTSTTATTTPPNAYLLISTSLTASLSDSSTAPSSFP